MGKVFAETELVSWRFRNDDDTEADATWRAALNTNITVDVSAGDVELRMRCLFRENNGVDVVFPPWAKYQINDSGLWPDITPTGLVVQSYDSSYLTHEDDTTQQLGAGTFLTPNSQVTEDGTGAAITLNAKECETEYTFKIISADVSDGDTVDIRFQESQQSQYNVYTPAVARITIIKSDGGQVYERTLSDNVEVADSEDRYTQSLRHLLDNVDLEDVLTRSIIGAAVTYERTLLETFELSDSMSVEKLLLRLLNDAFDLEDVLTRDIIQTLSRVLQDSVKLTDTLARVKHLVRNIIDSVELTDEQLRTLLLIRLLADEIEVSDSVVSVVERVKFIVLTDQFDVTDTTRTAQWYNHALTDSVDLNELVYRRLDILRHLADNVDLTDSVIAKIAGLVFRTLTEQFNLEDLLSTETILRINRTLTDAFALQDALNRNLLMVRLLSDNVDFVDSLDRWVSEAGLIIERILADNFSLYEVVNRHIDIERLLTQTLSVYDALSRTTELQRLLSDNVTIKDEMIKGLIRNILRTLTDQVDVSDNLISTFISALGDIGFIQYLVNKQAIEFNTVHEQICTGAIIEQAIEFNAEHELIYFDAVDAYPNLKICLLLR